jgi:hypothetical protein
MGSSWGSIRGACAPAFEYPFDVYDHPPDSRIENAKPQLLEYFKDSEEIRFEESFAPLRHPWGVPQLALSLPAGLPGWT